MDVESFIVTIFCLIDDLVTDLAAEHPWRMRGPRPTLADSEVLTIEVVGEYLGIDTDVGLYRTFRHHYAHLFPALPRVDRTTFTRQAANLWAVKDRLYQAVLTQLRYDPALSLVDSVPLPVCRLARAPRSRQLRPLVGYGSDAMTRQVYLGLRAHLRVCWPGVLVASSLAPADVHDRWLLDRDLWPTQPGWVVGDTSYWSPLLADDLAREDIALVAPPKGKQRRAHPWPAWLIQVRRRIETVASQLVERYHAKRLWARDAWHLTSRWNRKILSHTLAVFLCQQHGHEPLRLADLVTI